MDFQIPMESVSESPTQLAIEVRDVHLIYSKNKVLNDLELKVPCGSTFGLLGPSGCGKTSLIRCILGMVKVNSGLINVFGQPPGSAHPNVPGSGVGYMPQDISLCPDLTVIETLNYFGRLYGLDDKKRSSRCRFLIKFLELSDTDQLVGSMSGGQKRRVSLATALIHEPPLLILDEPTVGVDPLLRKSIWGHLIQLCSQGHFTVLITTHYIEEAKDANLVGLMRNGRILQQDSPTGLLNRFQFNTLEMVFLQLCTDEEESTHNTTAAETSQLSKVASSKSISSSESSGIDSLSGDVSLENLAERILKKRITHQTEDTANISTPNKTPLSGCGQIKAMAFKNVRTLWRNKGVMLFQLGLPTLEVVLFCMCIGLKMRSIPVAVYDGDQSDLSTQLLNNLDSGIIKKQYYTSVYEAIESVRKGDSSTALVMYTNFSSCLETRIVMLGEVEQEVMYNSTIHLHPDMSSKHLISFINLLII